MTAAQPRNATIALIRVVRRVTVPTVRAVGIRNVFRGVAKAILGDATRFPT